MRRLFPFAAALSLCLAAMPQQAAPADQPAIELDAQIERVSRIPDPAKAPYADCLTQIRLIAHAGRDEIKNGDPFIGVFWAFRARKLEPAAALQPGSKLKLRLRPFASVEEQFGKIMRLDDTADFSSPVYWVEKWESIGPAAEPAPLVPNPEPPQLSAADRILKVFEAHGGAPIEVPDEPFIFRHYRYLYDSRGWMERAEPEPGRPAAKMTPLEMIESFAAQLRERKIELVILFVPDASAIFPDVAANVSWSLERDGRVDREFVRFADALRMRGLAVIDPYPEFAAQRFIQHTNGKTYPIYRKSDIHWNGYGARIAARMAAEAIRKLPWHAEFRASGAPAYPHRLEPFLIGNVKPADLPPDSLWNGPDPFPLIKVIPEEGAPPYDKPNNPDAPVQLIGDSFATAEGGELRASFHNLLVAELQVPVAATATGAGAGSFSPILWSRAANLEKTKVVLWEIWAPTLSMPLGWQPVKLGESAPPPAAP